MIVTDAAGTRAECPVVAGLGTAAAVVVVVVVSMAAVSTAAAATGALLAAADDALRELTFPPDEVAAPLRAECPVAFFVAVESVLFDDVELPSELLAEALPAPDPAPVSA
ncbi:hypothetical protein [Mycobacterium sp. EPa45]|uniref:hypothetical protein n=1 Tax=Mycobacterium sp. EPa45 TaxID=1545728 RepID=UPI0006420345|nr:hypothetical protein [Mycobacterium sp. EPa45]AKK29821.1 hypothetical protein AB431_27575 [Mycobacterium sp. EPa45]